MLVSVPERAASLWIPEFQPQQLVPRLLQAVLAESSSRTLDPGPHSDSSSALRSSADKQSTPAQTEEDTVRQDIGKEVSIMQNISDLKASKL